VPTAILPLAGGDLLIADRGENTVILFDPRKGQLTGTEIDLRAPQVAGSYLLWAVLHDNRGGVSWVQVDLLAK